MRREKAVGLGQRKRERESIEIRSKAVAVVVCFWGTVGEGTRHAAADRYGVCIARIREIGRAHV